MKSIILSASILAPAAAHSFECDFAMPVVIQVFDKSSHRAFEGTGAYIGKKDGYYYYLSNAHVASMYMRSEDWSSKKIRKHNRDNTYFVKTYKGKKTSARLVDLEYENDIVALLSENYLSDGIPMIGYNTDIALFRTRRAYEKDMTLFKASRGESIRYYEGIAYSGYPSGELKNYEGDFYINNQMGIGLLSGEHSINKGASGSPIYEDCNYEFHGILNASLASDAYKSGMVGIKNSETGELKLVKRDSIDLSQFAAFATPEDAIIELLERNELEDLIAK